MFLHAVTDIAIGPRHLVTKTTHGVIRVEQYFYLIWVRNMVKPTQSSSNFQVWDLLLYLLCNIISKISTNLFKVFWFEAISFLLVILICITIHNKYIVSCAALWVFKIKLLPVKNDSETFVEQLLNEKDMTDIFQKSKFDLYTNVWLPWSPWSHNPSGSMQVILIISFPIQGGDSPGNTGNHSIRANWCWRDLKVHLCD